MKDWYTYCKETMKANGYTCKLEYRFGVECYVVRDKEGKSVNYGVSTFRTARQAWQEAANLWTTAQIEQQKKENVA